MRAAHSSRFLSLVLVLALIGGCRDGVSAELRGAVVRISLGGSPYDEETIAVGESIQLSADVLSAAGDLIDGETVEWSSSEPEVATVDADGTVTGVAEGAAYILAEHEVDTDSALVTVAAPVTGAIECVGSELGLATGETTVVEGDAATGICLAGGASGAEYSLVVTNLGTTASNRLQTSLDAIGLTTLGGPPTPNVVPSQRTDFHHRLRHDVSARLEPRLRSGIDIGGLVPPVRQTGVGDVVSFNVETLSSNGCDASAIDLRGGRVRAVSDRAIVVADTLNPSGGFSTADYQSFAETFDTEVWPLITGTFGTPSDIDRNGKVYIFFTRAVNERPENSSTQRTIYVGGFFFNRDLFPKTGDGACAGSNVAEMFYLLVPDPDQQVITPGSNPPTRAKKFTLEEAEESARSVIVHEFQHLVNDSRRLHVNQSPVWEETWLNEGLSHVAEELMFYEQTGLEPGNNLDGGDFGSAAAREAFERYQLDNLERLATFLRTPQTNSLMGRDLLETRGAAWHFLRYAADRRSNQAAFWRDLVTEPTKAGLDNLREALGEDPSGWIRDWTAAIYLDDAGVVSDPRYQVASWNLRDLYPAITMLWPPLFYQVYPLAVTRLTNQGHDTSISGGSAAYFRAGVAAGERAAVRVTVGELPPPSRLKVRVTRVR